MIELDRHIEILLLKNDCVIIPDLGGFMAHHIDARYDEDDHTFLPPLRTLGFNPQLTMNDSLLVQSYIEAYDLSYPEALRRIESEVSELKQQLEKTGSVELNDIGVLSLNAYGKYVFTPCDAGILTPELYGLSSFEMKPLEHRIPAAVQQQPAVAQSPVFQAQPTILQQQAVNTKPSAASEPAASETPSDGSAIVIKMSWLRKVAAVAVAILAVILMTIPVTPGENSHLTISNLNNTIFSGMMVKDTNMEKIDIVGKAPKTIVRKAHKPSKKMEAAPSQPVVTQAVEEVKQPEEPVKEIATETKATAAKEANEETANYCIVLASRVTKQNAETYVEKLHKAGLEKAEVLTLNNITRVICGKFQSESEAYSQLNSIRERKDFKEAWVLKLNSEV